MKKLSPTPDFVAHVVDSMRKLGPVEARRMFGGWGIYHQGLFFALVAYDTLYLKTDDGNRAEFDALELAPFTFTKKGEEIVTGYRQAPEEALESPAVMARWAKSAYGAALRKATGTKRRRKG
jgi:DNA transformation protein